ncbi:hypothetical protein COOONC_03504 [Cooperia oncophora]
MICNSAPSLSEKQKQRPKMVGGYDPVMLPLPFFFFTASTIGIIGNSIMIHSNVQSKANEISMPYNDCIDVCGRSGP